MRARRLAWVVSLAAPLGLCLLLVAPVAALAEDPLDTTPPVGTLTIDDGSGYSADPVVTLHVPATDDVGVVTVLVFDRGNLRAEVPYVEAIDFELIPQPYESWSDGDHLISVAWKDAAGNTAYSPEVTVWLDREAPAIGQITWPDDSDVADAMRPVSIPSADGSPVTQVRLSSNGTTAWSGWMPWASPVPWRYLDPSQGGSPRLGVRTLYAQLRDGAGNVSPVRSIKTSIAPVAPLLVTPAVPTTGKTMTITPQYPGAVSFPSGTYCQWEVAWGNDRSLYYADRDETFGHFFILGPASADYCEPLAFTVPWMPYRQVMVSLVVMFPGTEDTVQSSIGSSPEEEAIQPVVGSTSRHITSSSVPLVYVLPEDYTLVLGEPTTYRAYPISGAKVTSADRWSVAYVDTPLQRWGGTSFTFTPRTTGYLTVCWETDTTKSTRWAACFDPPVRRPDTTRPTTTTPVTRLATGSVGSRVPATVTWDGSDRGWGVATFQLERSVDGGGWRRIVSARVRTTTQSLLPGHAYRYRVRAVDRAGNRGDWDYGPTLRPRVVSDASSSVAYTSAWTRVADATATAGSLHESSRGGSAARYTFTGRDVAWIAERGPGHGRAKVYLDGTLAATVDLGAATDMPGRIVFRKHWPASGSHTVRIVVEGTDGRPIVGVDGFIVLR